jgi:hypothetical protein
VEGSEPAAGILVSSCWLVDDARLEALAKAREARWGKGKAAKAKKPKAKKVVDDVPY